jgi:hypothetical protein
MIGQGLRVLVLVTTNEEIKTRIRRWLGRDAAPRT